MTAAQYRIGKRHGQDRWQIKESPGWRVAHECDTLEEAAAWLRKKKIDLSAVSVVSMLPGAGGWPSLADALKKNLRKSAQSVDDKSPGGSR